MSIAVSFLDILPGHHMFTHLVELTSLLALTLENLVETLELLCTLSLVKKMVFTQVFTQGKWPCTQLDLIPVSLA